MFARALIVLLLVLNVGVALWWLARPEVPASAQPEPDTLVGVARLQLADASPASAPLNTTANLAAIGDDTALAAGAAGASAPTPDLSGDPGAASAPAARATRCLAFGPFTSAVATDRARQVLGPAATRLQVREEVVPSSSARGWRVVMPPLADRAAAQAMAARLAAAGFDDHFLMSTGDDANGIALGRYGSEASARRHADALRAAGFDRVEAQPLSATGSRAWIDVALAGAAGGDDALRVASGARRVLPRDCADPEASAASR